ncbi:unnamed protein product [Miscanthus lutarioriparius]|uniref:Uncharacterized protein n=1 Tax=Miscanthus lutarioriparius TaxID=422564 RepID=A0A811PEV3_9POAL|nr:unnamed protein product [Miscanthus lutarioriparius]
MAGQGHSYHDYFSQSSSSSVARTFFASAAAASDADDYSFFPDAPAAPNLSTPRPHMENLDLSSQVDAFPYLESYSGYLQSEEGRGEQALPPFGPGARSGHSVPASSAYRRWGHIRQCRSPSQSPQ